MERSTLMTTDRTSYYLLMCYLDRLSSLPYHLRLISSPGFLTVILLQRRLEILLRICQTSSHGRPPFAGRGNGYKGSSSISFLGTHLIQIVGEAGISSTMSLWKIPLILLESVSTHRITSSPNPTADRARGGVVASLIRSCAAAARVSNSFNFPVFPHIDANISNLSSIDGLCR